MISKSFEQRPDFFSVHISRHYGMFFFNLSDVKLGSLVSILPKFDQLFLAFHNLLQFLHIFLFRVAVFHTDLSTQKSAVLLLIRSWIFLRVRCGFECVFWAVLCCAASMFSVLFFFFPRFSRLDSLLYSINGTKICVLNSETFTSRAVLGCITMDKRSK